MLPYRVRILVAKIFPWWAVVIALYSIIKIFLTFAFGSVEYVSGGMFVTSYGQAYYLLIILAFANAAMYIGALPGVFGKKKWGWNLVLYSSVLYNLDDLITIKNSSSRIEQSSIITSIIYAVLFYYLLFQIRKYYK